MPTKQADNDTGLLFLIIALLWAGVFAHRLIGDEPVRVRKLIGELILAGVFGVALWGTGLMQGLSGLQLAVLGAFAALGGGRSIELVLRLIVQLKGAKH